MPFIPHTPADVQAMLAAIGAANLAALFDEIPPALRIGELPVRKAAAQLVPQMDAEVAALGRSTSAYNKTLEKS